MLKHRMAGFCVLVCALAAPPCAAGLTGHAAALAGHKDLNSADWAPLEGQAEWGAVTAVAFEGWPVHIALDLLVASDDSSTSVPLVGIVEEETEAREIALGVRKFWEGEPTLGYLGAGLSMLSVEAEVREPGSVIRAEEDTTAFWLGGGVLWRVWRRLELGVDLRWSQAEADLNFDDGSVDPRVEVGGIHVGVMVGFSWGAGS